MKKNKNSNVMTLDSDPRIDHLIYLTYCMAGWLFAHRLPDVARQEARQIENVDCPDEVLNADWIWERVLRQERSAPTLRPPLDHNAAENLARAAREGSHIPELVREIMRRDREAAEE